MINNLRYYRELRGFTQEEIASFVGLSRNSISSIERGEYLPTLKNAFLIARSLYVPVHLLFDFSDEMTIFNEVLNLKYNGGTKL